MISYLRGWIALKDAQGIVIDVGGVGYRVGMSTQSLSMLDSLGDETTVYTHMQVRDDGMSLFGFCDERERALFEKLITVSGVGPKVALSALSTFNADALMKAIASEDIAAVSSISGIGKKTAQRIVLELKGTLDSAIGDTEHGDAIREAGMIQASEALLGMGFSAAETDVALKGYDGDMNDTSAVLRYALRRLGAG